MRPAIWNQLAQYVLDGADLRYALLVRHDDPLVVSQRPAGRAARPCRRVKDERESQGPRSQIDEEVTALARASEEP